MASNSFAIPPNVLKLRRKIARIFLPNATKRAEKIGWDENSPARFVHYTSASAAMSIIASKSLWMRSTLCMADYREIGHGFDLLREVLSQKPLSKAFIDSLDACVPGVASEAFAGFDNAWGRVQRATYITCLSEHHADEDNHGRLSMWRAFAPGSARVAIVFSVPAFASAVQALSIIFSPVGYLTAAEVTEGLTAVTQNIQDNAEFLRGVDRPTVLSYAFSMLLSAVLSLKHVSFREELEWRAIHLPTIHPSDLMKSSIKDISGLPQLVYEIPLDATKSPALEELDFPRIFDRLIIGPTQFGLPMADAFASQLKDAGVKDAEERIWLSNIPIRT